MLITTMFSTLPKAYFSFWVTFNLSSANSFNFNKSTILSFSKELTLSNVSNNLKLFSFNSLPNGKFSDCSKLKAFADDKINKTEKSKFVVGRLENIVGQGENAVYQHFLLFPECFQKSWLCGKEFRVDCRVLQKSRLLVDIISFLLSKKGSRFMTVPFLFLVKFSNSLDLTLYHTILSFNDPEKDTFWQSCGKSLLFPQCYQL